jgi:hypothetical protein
VQAHASECYRDCGRPQGVPALSDQLAAVAVTMGERLAAMTPGVQRRSLPSMSCLFAATSPRTSGSELLVLARFLEGQVHLAKILACGAARWVRPTV